MIEAAARAEEAGGLIRQALSGISVAEVMTPTPVQAPDNISVEDALHSYILASRHTTFPTHDAGDRLSGLLTLVALKNVAPNSRATTLVKEIICPLENVSTARPADPATNLLDVSEGCSERHRCGHDSGSGSRTARSTLVVHRRDLAAAGHADRRLRSRRRTPSGVTPTRCSKGQPDLPASLNLEHLARTQLYGVLAAGPTLVLG